MKIFYKRLPTNIDGGAWHTSNIYLENALKDNKMYTEDINQADIIYAQENVGGLELFKKYPDKIKIVQLVCSHPDFYCKILQEELDKYDMEDIRPFNWAPVRKEEIELADYIIVYSKFTKKTCLDAGVPEEKIIVIPKGVETGVFKPLVKNKEIAFTIGFAGQLQLIKGLQYIPSPNEEFEVIVCGDKTEYLDKMGVRSWQFKKIYNEKFKDYGKLSKSGLVSFYNWCDVLVAPSIEDSMNMVVLEALSCGVPVITTVNTGAGELITHHKEGSIIPIRDTKAIYKEIIYWKNRLKKNGDKSTIYGACRILALNHTMDKYMADLISFLKKVKK